jgi:integrase
MTPGAAKSLTRSGRLGYDRTMITAHGFRGMASTLLHECGWPSDVIERQLSHAERYAAKAAYNHAEHLPARRKMMQARANHLHSLRIGGTVVTLRA